MTYKALPLAIPRAMRASAGVNFDTIAFELLLASLLIFAFCALVNPSDASAASRLLATRKWGMKWRMMPFDTRLEVLED
jgi:hypothetical protein